MGGPVSHTSTWLTQLKGAPHLGQSLHQEIRECAFEVPVQGLVVTLSHTIIPNRSIARCVAASLDTSMEGYTHSTNITQMDILLIPISYIDGISVTHGQSPRQHIWTFAVGFSERDLFNSCPCGSPTNPATIPPYIGENYFCETGYNVNSITISASLCPDDPLWDGEGCGSGHGCECTLHSPPWFTAQLNTATSNWWYWSEKLQQCMMQQDWVMLELNWLICTSNN